ncbi:polyprotein [Pyrenophora tritici-repentis]|nr:polyprotein [Pyrenophora tritici-repentis]KAI1676656.1 polyprotein [Pyrenophora tritici-repentis]
MAGTQAGKVGEYRGVAMDKAAIVRMLAKGLKPHRSQLPPLPTCRTKLEDHPMGELFKEAEQSHLASHHQMNSWTEIPIKKIKQTGQQILDCMWVYTYKLDKHHRLLKCKARLVVRGDQQRNITSQDTYAATLASRSFRMLTAIAAKYDLELKQYDVTNAFVHATIDREVFMRMPRGHQKPGTILKLNKALYGLRISPLLWQKEFTSTLKELGFQEVPHEPCCLIKGGIIIFFYVDDIILAYHKDMEQSAQQAIARLQEKYLFTGGNDLQWFLGVEIIRDRKSRTIQLSQAAYADKISRLADRTDIRHDTPMATAELLPRDGLACPSEINKYQRKIGSLLFAAVTTRPDIAFATSRLARFLSNPGLEHHNAADRVLLYLLATKHLALQLGGGTGLQIASDASFADNTLDRKSSQGYAIKLFNGLIAWKANKQDTVTTSTTEAELLALSQVAKEALFLSRLLKELNIQLDTPSITIQCDNKQTIRLVTEEVSKLQTKLRHVDIHNHWIRQEVSTGRISVEYIPTADMIADGLTKSLPPNKWPEFLEQLGLVPAKEILARNSAPLEEIQEKLENLVVSLE